MSFIVAIDGPAGTGKGTVTKILSEKFNFMCIDTGAMYRCVTLECVNKGILPSNENRIKEVLENIDIEIKQIDGRKRVFLNGKDVSEDIRTQLVNENTSAFSALKVVRDKITPMQQKIGENNNVIMEGRDIGTVVFPNADVKIYLDCSLEERARRRYKQNLENGINESYEAILESVKNRDKIDSEREIAPLTKAKDAIVIDSTDMTIEEVVNEIEQIIKEKYR